jgi:hypothetical protein
MRGGGGASCHDDPMATGSDLRSAPLGRPSPLLTPELRGADALDITCPRCGEPVHERFYGPCTSCRSALRASQGSAGREVEAEVYEPKMNVTPNAVALKE